MDPKALGFDGSGIHTLFIVMPILGIGLLGMNHDG
jgi:hypothetical protein